jgi:hypothetical protein
MMEAVRTSETSVDNHFTRQYIPEDSSEHPTLRYCLNISFEVRKITKHQLSVSIVESKFEPGTFF